MALIFDCDGVLINSETIYIDVEMALIREIGIDYAPAEYQARYVGLSHADLLTTLQADCADRGLAFPADFDARHKAAVARRFETDLRATPGVEALLQAHVGPRAVASSSLPESLAWKLERTGLAGYFAPHIYSTAEVPNGKPAPDVFLMAAAKLSADPGRSTVIEDSVNGVLAGKAAGMRVWGFTGGGHGDAGLGERLRAAGADAVFADFGEIAAALP